MNDVDRLITDEYESRKGEVLRTVRSKLGAAGVNLSAGDLDASYNEAWHALYMKLAEGEPIENRIGFLVTVTHRRALSEYRASRAGLRADESELAKVGVEFDLDAQLDAEIKVRHVVEGLRAGLSEREFEAATLCHLHGYSRPEAARVIGVKPKRMEKIMDGASNRIAAVLERVQAGEHCDGMDSRVRAYAVGMLDPEGERYEQTQGHISNCPACRRKVWVLRGLAAVVPPIPVLAALTAGSASTAGVAAHVAAAGGASGSASSTGAGGGAGASGGGAGAAADAGSKVGLVAAASSAAAVAAVAAVGLATGVIGGGDDSAAPEPPAVSASASGPDAGSDAASAQKAKAEAKAKARARAKAKARAKQRAKVARQRQLQAQADEQVVAEVPPPAAVYEEPAPAYVPPPEPEPEPELEPLPAPPPPVKPVVPVKPTTDAGDEFGLR